MVRGGGAFLKDSPLGGLRRVGPIQRQGHTAKAVGRRPDPGVLVSESPGLNRGAARSLETGANDATIDPGLTGKVVFAYQVPLWIQGKRNVKFGNLHLSS